MAQAVGQTRLMTWLLVSSLVALLLASIGIYGAVASSVAQRTTEIGVRMALGAQTVDVLKLIVRQGMAPVVSGLGIGIVATLARPAGGRATVSGFRAQPAAADSRSNLAHNNRFARLPAASTPHHPFNKRCAPNERFIMR